MDKQEIFKKMTINGINDFADMYVERIEKDNKENYNTEDIRAAFKEGANWMKSFLEIQKMVTKTIF